MENNANELNDPGRRRSASEALADMSENRPRKPTSEAAQEFRPNIQREHSSRISNNSNRNRNNHSDKGGCCSWIIWIWVGIMIVFLLSMF